MRLFADCWVDCADEGIEIEHPTLSQVMEAIDALDSDTHTLISLSPREDCYLMVGGPCNGRYMVCVTFDNLEFFGPRDKDAGSEKVICYIGGQDGDYELKRFVPRQIVDLAVTSFLEKCGLSLDIDWYDEDEVLRSKGE